MLFLKHFRNETRPPIFAGFAACHVMHTFRRVVVDWVISPAAGPPAASGIASSVVKQGFYRGED